MEETQVEEPLPTPTHCRGLMTRYQSDVRHFVRACPDCQIDKVVLVKIRLPMIISDTPSKPFIKISIDFVGPKEVTRLDNQYILTIQENFSKYFILTPTK